jgi:DNA-binding CsgD family transcriptional regulator
LKLTTVGVLQILDSIYRVERERRAWIAGVLDAMAPVLAGDFGIGAIVYDIISDSELRLDAVAGRGLPPGWQEAGVAACRDPRLTPWIISRYRSLFCESLNEAVVDPRFQEHHSGSGIKGQIVINGTDGSGRGCAIHVFAGSAMRLAETQRQVLYRIATHLATGYRLQQRLSEDAEPPLGSGGALEAVLTPLGHVEHAEGAAKDPELGRELAQAVQQRESSRRATRYGAERALRARKGLVAARWTLLDNYVDAGRRYVVARENEPSPRGPALLSRREQQVAGLAAQGHSNKLIAYELGLAHSTVRVLITRACAKLEVSSRTELVTRLAESS